MTNSEFMEGVWNGDISFGGKEYHQAKRDKAARDKAANKNINMPDTSRHEREDSSMGIWNRGVVDDRSIKSSVNDFSMRVWVNEIVDDRTIKSFISDVCWGDEVASVSILSMNDSKKIRSLLEKVNSRLNDLTSDEWCEYFMNGNLGVAIGEDDDGDVAVDLEEEKITLKEYCKINGIAYCLLDDLDEEEPRSEISESYVHELMDRSYMMLEMFNLSILKHSKISHSKEFHSLANEISNKLGDLYQIAGNIDISSTD